MSNQTLTIGPYQLKGKTILAPMAGVTDRPFRQLCRQFGAALTVSEMITSDSRLWKSNKTRWRLDHDGEPEPRSVQIVGGEPEMLAEAARQNEERGAHIIDINMGCPAKKVCNKAAGSALMKDEKLVRNLLEAVKGAVNVPVTLKIRTGWSPDLKNAVQIARIAEDIGISALSVHGRTRACGFSGEAEYATIAAVKSAVSIPVIANGDITSPEKAKEVLAQTGADGVMIGRAAQGKPWIFRDIDCFLRTGIVPIKPSWSEQRDVISQHITALHQFYGEYMGVRIARKHFGWYVHASDLRRRFNIATTVAEQLDCMQECFELCFDGEGLAA